MVRRSVLATALFSAAISAHALVNPFPRPFPPNRCTTLFLPPAETWMVPNQVIALPVQGDPLCFVTDVSTTTPTIIAVDEPGRNAGVLKSVTVHALAPGTGELNLMTGSGERFLALIHVLDCGEGSKVIKLQPAYSAVQHTQIQIGAEIHGVFNLGLQWTVNGRPVGTGTPTLLYTSPEPGVFDVTLRGESECGVVEAHAKLVVSAVRSRLVRH